MDWTRDIMKDILYQKKILFNPIAIMFTKGWYVTFTVCFDQGYRVTFTVCFDQGYRMSVEIYLLVLFIIYLQDKVSKI